MATTHLQNYIFHISQFFLWYLYIGKSILYYGRKHLPLISHLNVLDNQTTWSWQCFKVLTAQKLSKGEGWLVTQTNLQEIAAWHLSARCEWQSWLIQNGNRFSNRNRFSNLDVSSYEMGVWLIVLSLKSDYFWRHSWRKLKVIMFWNEVLARKLDLASRVIIQRLAPRWSFSVQ